MDELIAALAEALSTEALAQMTVRAVLFREAYGRDAAIAAGCVEDVLNLAAALGAEFVEGGADKLRAEILGAGEADDVLAGILAATEAAL